MVRSAEEHLRRQVPALLFARWAGDNDRLKWELLHPGGDISVTVFAGDDELLAFLHHEPHERIVMTEITDQGSNCAILFRLEKNPFMGVLMPAHTTPKNPAVLFYYALRWAVGLFAL